MGLTITFTIRAQIPHNFPSKNCSCGKPQFTSTVFPIISVMF